MSYKNVLVLFSAATDANAGPIPEVGHLRGQAAVSDLRH